MLRQVGETSVAYYFGKLAGADLVIDASGLSRPLLADPGPQLQGLACFPARLCVITDFVFDRC
jgi:hypothetical protein